MSDFRRIAWLSCAVALLCGCGQTGKLYLPEPAGEVVTRPAQAPAAGDAAGAPADSPQTVDSPPQPDNPAPEVSAPEPQRKDKDEKVEKKN